MSDVALTVVAGFRDREIERVERWLASLAAQTFRGFRAILVDYGSARDVAARLQAAAARHDFCSTVYTDTRGHAWSRACALNIGARLAASDYVLLTDVDMIYPPGFLAAVIERIAPGRVIHAWCTFLPRGFSHWDEVFDRAGRFPPAASRPALGGCQALATALLHAIGGLDEYYRFWGAEDRDLADRLLLHGLEDVYLPSHVPMLHQWHPSSNDKSDDFMPEGLWGRMNNHRHRHRGEIARNGGGWGRVVRTEERPAFVFLDFERQRLVESPELHLFDARPDRPRESGLLVHAFWELPPGHALAVDHAFFPHRSRRWDWLLRATNAAARRVGSGARLGYRTNLLHAYLDEMLEANRGEIADYYLGFPARDGVSIVVRGGEGHPAAPW
ncbi:MAG TPA: glycosyltransferase [Thermoanaerobaculia bacterium]|nr:glycosyltransferase [Thermoanaerobaculia bacterium]